MLDWTLGTLRVSRWRNLIFQLLLRDAQDCLAIIQDAWGRHRLWLWRAVQRAAFVGLEAGDPAEFRPH